MFSFIDEANLRDLTLYHTFPVYTLWRKDVSKPQQRSVNSLCTVHLCSGVCSHVEYFSPKFWIKYNNVVIKYTIFRVYFRIIFCVLSYISHISYRISLRIYIYSLCVIKMKPPTIWPFVPPVTGANGIASAVNANLFDPSANFSSRPRSNSSAKRMRTSDGEQSPYDITRDFPPLTAPPPPCPSTWPASVPLWSTPAAKWPPSKLRSMTLPSQRLTDPLPRWTCPSSP
jgi:hypothetical protein